MLIFEILWKLCEKILVDYIYWALRNKYVRLVVSLSLFGVFLILAMLWMFQLVSTPIFLAILGFYVAAFAMGVSFIAGKYNTVVNLQIDCLKNMCSLIPNLPIDRKELAKISQDILKELVHGTAGSSFGGQSNDELTQWRASVLVYDGRYLSDFALLNYPAETRLAFVSSVCWKIFMSRDPKDKAWTCPGDLDKDPDFVREAISLSVNVPRSKSMACTRIETADGFRIGTVQVVSPKPNVFDHKKMINFMKAGAEILASVVLSDPNKKTGRIPSGAPVYIFEIRVSGGG